MSVARGWVAAAGWFLYGFLVGDDWLVAAVMLLALAGSGLLIAAHVNTWWLVPPVAVVMTGVSLRRAAARRRVAAP